MDVAEVSVFVDLETCGLNPEIHPIIQIAAVAVDSSSLCELEQFELKVRFDESRVEPKALHKNQYSKTIWEREALEPHTAAQSFARFLRRHATFDMRSRDGRPYQVAQLVAHNGERFDGPFLHAWYQQLGLFCPARYMVLCTKQRALWLFDEDKRLSPPTDYRLGTLCEFFGVQLRAEDAHDAFHDVRATVELYRAMRQHSAADQQEAA